MDRPALIHHHNPRASEEAVKSLGDVLGVDAVDGVLRWPEGGPYTVRPKPNSVVLPKVKIQTNAGRNVSKNEQVAETDRQRLRVWWGSGRAFEIFASTERARERSKGRLPVSIYAIEHEEG